MSTYIRQTRQGENYALEVRVPIRRVRNGMSFEEMQRAPIINIESRYRTKSILSKLDGINRTFSNIEGMNVTMVCRIHEDITEDEVIVRGMTPNYYIVEINKVQYSVNKSCAIFTIMEE